MAKKKVKRARRKFQVSRNSKEAYNKKINFVLKNLIFFASLFLIVFILSLIFQNELFQNIFSLLIIIFGSISGALVIALLVFIFLKILKKK